MSIRRCFFALVLLILLPLLAFCQSAEQEAFKREKARILTEKGIKQFTDGRLEDAIASFEEAYESYPESVHSLLVWGEILCRSGLYDRAMEILARIPAERLPPAGQIRVYLLVARIKIASDSLPEAAEMLEKALKTEPGHRSARIRLAMIKAIERSGDESSDLLKPLSDYHGAELKDCINAFILDLNHADLTRAWNNSQDIVNLMDQIDFGDDPEPFLWSLWTIQPAFFISALPFGLTGGVSIFYVLVIALALMFLSWNLAPAGKLRNDFIFLGAVLAHVIILHNSGIQDLRLTILKDDFFLLDPIWFCPRLLCAANFWSLSLFLIFPAFLLLPSAVRPTRSEYYAVWFFGWWFMFFILAFQTRFENNLIRMALMTSGMILTVISALFMPLGQYVLFLIGKTLGISALSGLQPSEAAFSSSVSFTDIKIQEAKALKMYESDDFTGLKAAFRSIAGKIDLKSFPAFWLTAIKGMIEAEEFFEAADELKTWAAIMKSPRQKDQGDLHLAFIKSLSGDHAAAYSWIKSLPEDRARSFSNDETSLSLLILGRCNRSFKEYVQAHIDLSSALKHSSGNLLHARILCELADLDSFMNRPESVGKWAVQARNLQGGPKTESFKRIVESMEQWAGRMTEKALEKSLEACELFPGNSRAFAWRGHLLCVLGKKDEAEALLQKMQADTAESQDLMAEITGTGNRMIPS